VSIQASFSKMVLGKRTRQDEANYAVAKKLKARGRFRAWGRRTRAIGVGRMKVSRKTMFAQAGKSLFLPMALNPFPPVWKTTMSYPIRGWNYAPGTVAGVVKMRLNSLYDFDVDSQLGDLQPLFLDQILSTTGPYQKYRVTGWRIKITAENTINAYAATVNGAEMIVGQGYFATTDIDSIGECRNMPNTQVRLLGWYGIPSSRGVAYLNGTVSEFVTSDVKDDSLVADAGTNPSQTIYGFLALANLNVAGASVTANIMVQVEQDVEFLYQDAVAS